MASTIEFNISKWELNEQLRLAAEFGLLDDVIQCLNDGAEIDSGDANDGLTALHWATYGGHDSVVDYICRHKGNINITNYFGSTPLQHACVMGHENIVRILLRHNVDTSIKDRDGYTPLDFALRNGHHTIVDLIKNYDSDLQILQAAMKQGIVSSNVTKCLVQGPARAGKTSIKSMILETIYDETLSTRCIEGPHVAVGIFTQSNHLHWLKVDEKDMTDKVTAELKAVAAEIKSKPSYTQGRSTITTSSTNFTPSHSTTSSHGHDQMEMGRLAEAAVNELLSQSSKSDNHMAGLGQHKQWLYFIDSGGQIQFQKLLQAFVPCASVLLLVVNLAEDFSSPSHTVMRCPDGDVRISGDSIPVEDLLQQLVAFVTSTAQGQKEMIERDPVLNQVIKPPSNLSVITVGTHRDEYDEKCAKREKIESIEKKEAKLFDILSKFGINIRYTEDECIIHQVDGRKAKLGIYDDDVIRFIQKELQDKSYKISVPLKWYCFSLLLNKLATQYNKFGVIHIDDCFEVGSLLNVTRDEVTSALKFFHILNTFLYYHDSTVCDLVFVLPQFSIIKIISELMAKICAFRSREGAFPHLKAFALQGMISEVMLLKYSTTCHELSKLFPSFETKLLSLFQHLLVASRDSNDHRYFIPALLPVISSSKANPFPKSISLIYYFQDGSPMGLFCAMITDILSQSPAQSSSSSWSIVTDPQRPTYSNRIILSNNSMNGVFAIIEKLYWFEVVCQDSRYQKAIRKAVDVAIARVISKRNLPVNIKPRKAFICSCGNIPSPHVCITSTNYSTVTCINTNISTEATNDQLSWFDHAERSNLYSKPRIGDLMSLLVPVAPQYSTIGTCLNVPMHQLGLDSRVDHKDNLRTTLQWWMDNGDNPSVNSPVTWDNIITVIEGPVQNYEVSQKIKQFAMSVAAVRETPDFS